MTTACDISSGSSPAYPIGGRGFPAAGFSVAVPGWVSGAL
jgi:hypothetical protein